ncbi:hypothetical protein QQ25_18240 [Mycolicibacterium setense]|nr:hypothetical protein QQ25_18240 [Mycolicibacterium setense]
MYLRMTCRQLGDRSWFSTIDDGVDGENSRTDPAQRGRTGDSESTLLGRVTVATLPPIRRP